MHRMTRALSRYAILLLCFLCAWGCHSDPGEGPVRTRYGYVQGIVEEETNTLSYRGIPYAAPPVGGRRFQRPHDPEPWEGVLAADRFGPPCWQPSTPLDSKDGDYGREDCLTLNVWRPRKKGTFPTIVYIHGGTFIIGSGSYGANLGDRIADQGDVVLVTMNYRLGPFGFLAHRDLEAEDPDRSAGNYGILDQIKALEWVRENIEHFGGDPGNVTLYGQSAGGVSVCTILASPLAEGLFHKAVMSSGMCDFCLPRSDGFELGEMMAEAVGCPEGPGLLDCLRGKDARTILEAVRFDPTRVSESRYRPHIDGHVVPDLPLRRLQQGLHRPVPVIVGTCRDEYSMFIWFDMDPDPVPMTWDQYECHVRRRYADLAEEILELYPRGAFDYPMEALSHIEGDRWFRCKARAAAEALSRHHPDTYLYHFTFDGYWAAPLIGATHGMDEVVLFESFDWGIWSLIYPLGPGPGALRLSDSMLHYWAGFAAGSDPNGEGLPAWPRYETNRKQNIIFDSMIRLENDLLSEECDFWDVHG